MGDTIGVFIGSASSFNIVRAASHIGEALSQNLTPDLVTTEPEVVAEVRGVYDGIHGTTEKPSIRGEISALSSYIHNRNPDVLFQITRPPIHGTIVGSLARRYSIPFVYRYSGDRFYEYKISSGIEKLQHFGLNNLLGRFPLYLADHCIALGPSGRTRLKNRGVDENDISIIPPIVDTEKFSPDGPTADLDTDRYIGLFAGRISRRKGKKTLERTIPKILRRRSDLEFVFIGEQTESLAIPSQYKDHITVVGSVPPDDVPQYYRAADFLIHPSLTEGLPRVILEAIASGTPPIARDVGDIPYATKNTFQTESEFVEIVITFEQLLGRKVYPFNNNKIGDMYVDLFKDI
ncbi:glycosyltransferase family 4 protein [Halorubrum salinarum]|uniref:Glycosyltransferase family 4 protein n=1 Tax=Halorubrum salinarum TaxID=2739057 RepID=A0A7D3Y9K5_9EURY|nr:glycosyltransferase family 4 protein [Halorubrum salinarum]QKG92045.1 glycosyltransferase family 4 protein [Halorubrum salinarum]